MKVKRSHKQEKLARVYDDEVLPLWTRRFAGMLLREASAGPRAMILEVGCATGYVTLELLRRHEDARLIALEPASPLLDIARKKVGALSGKRVFFHSGGVEPKLSFDDEVYDLVTANLVLHELDDPQRALRDLARVAKVGARVVATLPLRGTWTELYDIFREVLVKHDKHDARRRLDEHIASLPDADEALRWLERAGLEQPRLEVEDLTLLFRSSRELFFAPVIEYGPLPAWKAVAGTGQEMQDIFWHIKEAIDAYFGKSAFALTVKAACLSGVRPAAMQTVPQHPPGAGGPNLAELSAEALQAVAERRAGEDEIEITDPADIESEEELDARFRPESAEESGAGDAGGAPDTPAMGTGREGVE